LSEQSGMAALAVFLADSDGVGAHKALDLVLSISEYKFAGALQEKAVAAWRVVLRQLMRLGAKLFDEPASQLDKMNLATCLAGKMSGQDDVVMRLSCVVKLLSAATPLASKAQQMQDVIEDVARSDDGGAEEAWYALSLVLDAFDERQEEGDKIITDSATEHEVWLAVKEQCKGVFSVAKAQADAFVDGHGKIRMQEIEDKRSILHQLASGMADGTPWKHELTEESTFAEALEKASTTLFRQKGLKGKLESALSDLMEAMKHGGETRAIPFMIEADMKEECDATLQFGKATLAEAMFLQLLKGNPEKPSPAVVGKIQSEANYLAQERVDTRLLLSAVWTRVQKCLAQ
jgi:hypothetical protein